MGGATGLVPTPGSVLMGTSSHAAPPFPPGQGWFPPGRHTHQPTLSHSPGCASIWEPEQVQAHICRPVPVINRPAWGIDLFIPEGRFMSTPCRPGRLVFVIIPET